MKNFLVAATLIVGSIMGVGQTASPQLDSATQQQVAQIISSEHTVMAQLEALEAKHQSNMGQLRMINSQVVQKYPGYHLNSQTGILEKNQ